MPNQRKAGKRFFGVWLDGSKQKQIDEIIKAKQLNKTEFAQYAFYIAVQELLTMPEAAAFEKLQMVKALYAKDKGVGGRKPGTKLKPKTVQSAESAKNSKLCDSVIAKVAKKMASTMVKK